VYAVVRQIPEGYVMSYGQVALFLDMPRGAREVGWALSRVKGPDMVPWWRVVNNKGRVSIKGKYSAEEQRQLLLQEGIKVSEDFTFEIEKYRYNPWKKTGANMT
jgi:methylated-DNA-protein-cysteine methyltransferase-like protein